MARRPRAQVRSGAAKGPTSGTRGGWSLIRSLLDDEEVSEICINSPDQVYVERRGRLERLPERLKDADELKQVIDKLLEPAGRCMNEAIPFTEVSLPDGCRVHIVGPAVAAKGPVVTVWRPPSAALTMADLVNFGSLTHEMDLFLAVAILERFNILLAGGMASGKMTLANALCSGLDERVITVEDRLALRPTSEHLCRLHSGPGVVTMGELVRAAREQRADRVVISELRGPEALDVLLALDEGWNGTILVMHAKSSQRVLPRLEMLALLSGTQLPVPVLRRELIVPNIDLIVYIARLADGSRKITNITEVVGMDGDDIVTQDLFLFRQREERGPRGQVLGKHMATEVPSECVRRVYRRFVAESVAQGVTIPEGFPTGE